MPPSEETSEVRCYAGAAYPERPLAFCWHGAWLDVVQVLAGGRTPAGVSFLVLAADGRRYRLVWDQVADRWTVTERE